MMRYGWIAIAVLFSGVTDAGAENWPAWRGPTQQGVTSETRLPSHWSPTENIRWRVDLPERGNSTPIVWEDRVFVTQALEKEQRRTLMCFCRADGKLLWQKGVTYSEEEPSHSTNPYCSSSPVTDGERVIVWHGSAGVVCYDLDGRKLWERQLGPVTHGWGYGSSPVLVEGLCILNHGPGDPSFVIALDKRTGETVWKFDVPHQRSGEKTALGPNGDAGGDGVLYGSWATPLVIEAGGRAELILALPQRLVGCDPKTGKEYWSCNGLADLVYATPVASEGVVVALGGFYGPSLAVKAGGTGDVTEQRLWHQPRSRLRLPAAIIHDDHLYLSDMQGILECQELRTGKETWKGRAAGTSGRNDTWSSMVRSGDQIYLPNQSGDVFIFRADPKKFELTATNSLGEPTNSSLAISHGDIFLRTHKALWCIGKK